MSNENEQAAALLDLAKRLAYLKTNELTKRGSYNGNKVNGAIKAARSRLLKAGCTQEEARVMTFEIERDTLFK